MLAENKGMVVIFSTSYLPFLGGAETAVKGITDEVDDFSFVMLTACFERNLPRAEKMGNVIVYRLGAGTRLDKFFLPLTAFFKFLSLKKSLGKPILFWAVMVSYSSLAALFLKYFYPQIPLLLTVQEGDSAAHIRYSRFGLIGLFWRRLLKRADRIQVISHYLKELCLDFGARAPIEVIPNGVDLEKFKVKSENLEVRNENLKTVITVSRLVYKNGIDTLILALAEVKKRIPDVELHIVGDGPLGKSLARMVYDLGLENDVKFFGNISHDKIPQYLAGAHVFVRPSRSEGLGTAFLEAMAAGLPVIATPVGGIKDFLRDGETGLMTKIDEPQYLAGEICRLLTDGSLREKLARNGKKLVEDNYQWRAIASRMRNIFVFLLS